MLGLLVAVAAVLRAAAALGVPAPSLLPDETAYALLGRGLWHHGTLAVLGGPSRYASALYPALSWPLGYDGVRVAQALLASATAIVVFVWARALAPPRWALAAAALTLALPGFVYAGTIVPETLFVLLATLAGWLAVRALAEPSLRNQAFLALTLAACAATRGEANMLALALLAAAVAGRRVRALWPTWAAAGAICAVWLGLGGGWPLHALGDAAGGGTGAGAAVALVLEHAGELLLVCGVLPAVALVLLALTRPEGRSIRASVAYALALAVVAPVEVGVLAAAGGRGLLERELVFALPPLFVGFAAWLGRGAPRPPLRTLAVGAAAVAALLAIPFGRLATAAAAPENPSLTALTHLDSPRAYGVVALVALAAGALLLVRRRWLWALPLAIGAVLTAASVSASEGLVDRAQAARATLTAPATGWIDRAAAGPVTYLYDGVSGWRLAWSQLYWNPRIAHVVDLPAVRVPGPLPQEQLQLVPDDGALRLVGGAPLRASLLAAPEQFHFRGRELARSPRLGLALWALHGPPRLETWAQGVAANGDVPQGGVATLEVFDCGAGTFRVVALGRDNEKVRLSLDGNPVAQTQLWPGGIWQQSVSTPASGAGKLCTFSLATSSILRLEAFSWSRR